MYHRGKAEWLRRMYYPDALALRALPRGIANMTAGNWETEQLEVTDATV